MSTEKPACDFIAALLMTATKMFFNSKWINRLWHIDTMEYYSVIRRNELSNYKKIIEDP